MLDLTQGERLFTQRRGGLYLPKESLVLYHKIHTFDDLSRDEYDELARLIELPFREEYYGVEGVMNSRVSSLLGDMFSTDYEVNFYIDGLSTDSVGDCIRPVKYVGITQPKSQMNSQQLKIREVCDEMNEFGFSNVRTDTLRKKAIRTHKARLEELLEGYDVVMLKSSCKEMTTAVMKPSTYEEYLFREI